MISYTNGWGFLTYGISMGGDFKAMIYQGGAIFKIRYTDGWEFKAMIYKWVGSWNL
jgi:hypothetical protein